MNELLKIRVKNYLIQQKKGFKSLDWLFEKKINTVDFEKLGNDLMKNDNTHKHREIRGRPTKEINEYIDLNMAPDGQPRDLYNPYYKHILKNVVPSEFKQYLKANSKEDSNFKECIFDPEYIDDRYQSENYQLYTQEQEEIEDKIEEFQKFFCFNIYKIIYIFGFPKTQIYYLIIQGFSNLEIIEYMYDVKKEARLYKKTMSKNENPLSVYDGTILEEATLYTNEKKNIISQINVIRRTMAYTIQKELFSDKEIKNKYKEYIEFMNNNERIDNLGLFNGLLHKQLEGSNFDFRNLKKNWKDE
jgi:hypothetical protein